MKLIRYCILFAVVLLIGSPAQAQSNTPEPVRSFAARGITANLYQEGIQQGRAGLISVAGENIASAQVAAFDQTTVLFPVGELYYGFVVPRLDQPIRTYDMTVTATLANNQTQAILVPIEVRSGQFIQQDVILPPDLEELVNRQVEDDELGLISSLTSRVSDIPYWLNTGFEIPFEGELTSPFGAQRTFNGVYETLHTGWDFNGGMGDIMRSVADGRVVYAGNLPIRGGYVLINHGNGVHSGYAHLSVIHVAEGVFVQQGQLIGLAGNTGRSSDPHLHVEMQIQGRWIDLVDFINMDLP
ncbi:MAG: M23 family metallopeptidase [Chloroflexota bacterium]